MIRFVEGTVFLRPLNYLRVRHPYALKYNWIYPLVLGSAISFGVLTLGTAADAFDDGGLILSLIPLLSILSPFYIAALAAVSTFSGNDAVDKPFQMRQPVLLSVIGSGGDWEDIEVTPRHFLSMLFGYSTALSLLLLLLAIFSPLVLAALQKLPACYVGYGLSVFLCGFLFMFSQLVLGTLLGVYFLADKIHRS